MKNFRKIGKLRKFFENRKILIAEKRKIWENWDRPQSIGRKILWSWSPGGWVWSAKTNRFLDNCKKHRFVLISAGQKTKRVGHFSYRDSKPEKYINLLFDTPLEPTSGQSWNYIENSKIVLEWGNDFLSNGILKVKSGRRVMEIGMPWKTENYP